MNSSPLTPHSSLSPPFPLRLSQGHLNLLATCPRKFQHTYLEQLAAPSTPDQQEKQILGTRFHLLMQQWQLGLPVEPLLKEDAQLRYWFTAFVNAAPKILSLQANRSEVLRQSEHSRTLEFQGYLLTVVYDLLLSDDRHAQILDWKTYARPRNPQWLLQNWQTRLYPFILVETSHFEPEHISMVYWFFQSQGQQAEVPEPQSLTVAYNTTQHEQTRRELTFLLEQLTMWLAGYQAGGNFPQVGLAAEPCGECSFAVRCDPTGSSFSEHLQQRSSLSQESPSLPTLADIQEIPL